MALGDRPRRGASRRGARRAATCASSTPGTSSGSARRKAVQDALQRADTLDEQRAVLLHPARPPRPYQGVVPGPPASGPFLFFSPAEGLTQHAEGRHPHPRRLEKLKQEIEHLSTTKRREVAERIKEARSSATSPRTPSTTTPRTSRRCSSRASSSSRTSCARATVIDAPSVDTDKVRVGSQGHSVKDEARARRSKYHDRRLHRGRPVGEQALQRVAGRQGALGHKKGDIVKVTTAQRQGAQAQRSPRSKSRSGRRGGSRVSPSRRPARRPPRASSTRCARRASSRSRTPTRA